MVIAGVPAMLQEPAELVAVQADRMRLIIHAGTADVHGRGMLEDLLLDHVPVEPGDHRQAADDGGSGPANRVR
jgi:hypothetical protein